MASQPPQQRLTKLYVAKFGQGTGYDDIKETFEKFGEIFDCKVNARANYATVCYLHPEDAEKAIEALNGSTKLGGTLLVEPTFKKSNYEDSGSRPRYPYDGGRGGRDNHSRERDRGDDYGKDRRDYGRDRGNYGRGGDFNRDRRDYGRGGDDYGRDSRGGRYGGNHDDNRGDDNRGGYSRGGQGRYEGGGDRGFRGGDNRSYGGDRRPDRYGGGGDRYPDRNQFGGGDSEKDRMYREKLCYNCKGTGHISRMCPEARNNNNNGGSNRDNRTD